MEYIFVSIGAEEIRTFVFQIDLEGVDLKRLFFHICIGLQCPDAIQKPKAFGVFTEEMNAVSKQHSGVKPVVRVGAGKITEL